MPCPHCDEEIYCSANCQTKAWESFHSVLCPCGDPDHPVAHFNAWAYAQPDPYRHVYLELTLKMCAMVLCDMRRGQTRAQAWDRFAHFPEKRASLLPQVDLEALTEHCRAVCRDPDVDVGLTSAFVQAKLGQLALNLQFIEPQQLGVSVPLPRALVTGYAGVLERCVCVPYTAPQECEGSSGAMLCDMEEVLMVSLRPADRPLCVGLYNLQSTISHSCAPSAVLRTDVSAEMVVYATQDMDLGAEVTLCYVQMHLGYAERQEKLKWYERECACARCLHESNTEDGNTGGEGASYG